MGMEIPSTHVGRQAELRDAKRRRKNAQKAKKAADRLFPAEKWIKVEDGIYLSPRRTIGKKSNYGDELRDAQILRDTGSTVYLVPENSRQAGKKYDAIVDGMKMEFKNQNGASTRTLKEHFFKSREQAPNVFINLENSDFVKQQVINALYDARNNTERYTRRNRFSGGKIVLKIKEQERLIYTNVDDFLKIEVKKTRREASGGSGAVGF